ncbi:peptide chain release factor N(5)-glutamine methyltransferase [Telmatospirillum siberiense]|uniref:Release factor glutamine methyltransferase n=1 Tax=Telmatospirillum siberiense TaxID=382514 RepID=A0A2N3Q0Y4_9PROT|nr:peptide chain release factor N(5)-glutamine methyltransferase [Telmatospirillum siberiense]PKU26328.1 peptide chain release factor N(5)-glutamine methyltransferase [Telmatospirillum siberiense]
MTTVGAVLAEVTGRLQKAGIPSARLDARMLLAHVLEIPVTAIFSHPEKPISDEEEARVRQVAERRLQREPMSHIVGHREFWSLSFKVTADTLDPRPDTETVVEAVLAALPDRRAPLRLLDFGTGSGCILLSLLRELPEATGIGIDISPAALSVARENAKALGLQFRAGFVLGHWGQGVEPAYDVIVANPPYIPDGEIDALEDEVALYEPRGALAGGIDGLGCYRALAPDIARLLKPGGLAALEVGKGQAEAVGRILLDRGLGFFAVRRDLAGVERCVMVKRQMA